MNRILLAAITAIATLLVGGATAQAAPNRPATPPPTDFWQNLGFINMAHQGGERENPGNTMFAFKKAIADGADVIDLDVTLTKDNVLVATHDREPCHTSNAPCPVAGGKNFREYDLNELREFDFGYWFSPGLATYYDKSLDVPHPYRGMATGAVQPPQGYSASDFRISTFDEVLKAFPDTPINVELKPYADAQATADAAAAVFAANPGRSEDVIVNSFSQELIEEFHTAASNHLALGGSLEGTLSYVTGNPITPTPVAVQPPDKYNLGSQQHPNIVDTLPLLSPHFEHDGFIAVVWPSDLDENQETDPWYEKLIAQGADAINTMFPSRLHEYLCETGVPAADGKARCAAQEIRVKSLKLSPARGMVKAGKKRTVTLSVSTTTGVSGVATIRLKSSNRMVKIPAKISLKLVPGKTVKRKITIRATGKAKGKARITATSGKVKATANLSLKPVRGR